MRAANYRSSLRPAVIPAELRTNKSTSAQAVSVHRNPLSSDSVVTQASAQQTRVNLAHTPDLQDVGESTSATTADTSIQANMQSEVNSGENAQAVMPRVVFVRETELVTAEVPVTQLTVVNLPRGPVMIWSVQMMRVTFAAPVLRQQMQMPAAKKI